MRCMGPISTRLVSERTLFGYCLCMIEQRLRLVLFFLVDYRLPVRISYDMQRYFHQLRRIDPDDSEERKIMIQKEHDLVKGVMEGGLVEYIAYMDSFNDPARQCHDEARMREKEGHESALQWMTMARRDVVRAEADVVMRDVSLDCQSLLLERIEVQTSALKAIKANPDESAGSKLRSAQDMISGLLRDKDMEEDYAVLAAGKRKRRRRAFYDMDVDGREE